MSGKFILKTALLNFILILTPVLISSCGIVKESSNGDSVNALNAGGSAGIALDSVLGIENRNIQNPLAIDSTGTNIYILNSANEIFELSNLTGYKKKLNLALNTGTLKDIAVHSSGILAVLRSSSSYLSIFNISSGVVLSTFGGHGDNTDQMNDPDKITFDKAGNLYVLQRADKKVHVFSQAGIFLRTFAIPTSETPVDLVVTVESTLPGPSTGTSGRVAILFNQKYVTYNLNGEVTADNFGVGSIQSGKAINMDSHQYIHVLDSGTPAGLAGSGVRVFKPDGVYQGSRPHGSGLDSALVKKDLAVSPNNVYVLTGPVNNQSLIFRFYDFLSTNSPGPTLPAYGIANAQLAGTKDVAVNSAGEVFVVEDWNCRITKLDASGNVLKKFGSCGSTNGKFGNPQAVALAANVVPSNGSIFVADNQNRRVVVFDSQGVFVRNLGPGLGPDEELDSVMDVAYLVGGKVAVLDSVNSAIGIYGEGGNFIVKINITNSGGAGTYALWSNAAGELFVKTPGKIQKIDLVGTVLATYDNSGFVGPVAHNPATQKTYAISDGANPYSKLTIYDSEMKSIGSQELTGVNGARIYINGVAVDTEGKIYVGDSLSSQILIYKQNL